MALTKGATVDPAYNPSVAVFSITQGGLILEASAGGIYLSFKPRENDLDIE